MELDPHFCPEEIMSREVELGLSKLDVFCFELSKLFVNSGATDIALVTLSSTAVERAIARCNKSLGNGEGTPPLTLPLFWRRSTVSPVFFGRFPRSSQSPCPLSHSVPVPNRSSCLRGRKQHKSQKKQKGEPKWNRTQVLQLSSLTPHR